MSIIHSDSDPLFKGIWYKRDVLYTVATMSAVLSDNKLILCCIRIMCTVECVFVVAMFSFRALLQCICHSTPLCLAVY